MLHIYPNPTQDVLNIESADFNAKSSIEILDSQGQSVDKIHFNNEGKVSHSLRTYPIGIYIIKIISDRNVYYQKFIKE